VGEEQGGGFQEAREDEGGREENQDEEEPVESEGDGIEEVFCTVGADECSVNGEDGEEDNQGEAEPEDGAF